MYTEGIPFNNSLPVVINVYHIDEYALHCHEDAIEIILVLQGTVKVKVSFEYFTLSEGDYVVVNQEDSHKIWRCDERDNMVAVFQINLKQYCACFPYIHYVLFACESFDLARYKGQNGLLRRELLHLLSSMLRGEEERMASITGRLMDVLVREYSLERYYNREREIRADKLEIYYTIIKYMYEKYPYKTILKDISQNEFYSKSYISHLFKEVGAASFQDMLGYIRVYKAERLLLETDCGVTKISQLCGFSNPKYFNLTFKKWFLIGPFEYRKNYQSQVGKESKVLKVADDKIAVRIKHLEKMEEDNAEYKVSMTPITLKNIGSKTDLLNCLNQNKILDESAAETGQERSENIYAVIRIGNNRNLEHTKKLMREFLHDFQSKVDSDIDCWFLK